MNASTAGPGGQDLASWDEEYDLIVLGSGVGGLTAALVAATEGLRTLVLEKSAWVGGTSARSSGTVWIPNSDALRGGGVPNDEELATQYLDALVGTKAERGLRQAFLKAGPEMLRYLATHVEIGFKPYPVAPDYRQDLPGAALGLRPLEPEAFDGRTLGPHFAEVGWPLPELMLFGGMMVTRGEIARLLKLPCSWDAWQLGASLVLRYARDRLFHARGTRLVLGNALVARLYRHLLNQGVPVRLNAAASELIRREGRVCGVAATVSGKVLRMGARRGVVLAGGGFPANAGWRSEHLPSPVAMYTPAFEGCTGDTIQMAQRMGAALGTPGEDNALWFPSSVAMRKNGSLAVYPHIVLDRAKPGLIAVNSAGRRFANEAVSYHEFTRAMYRAHRRVPCIPAVLVCDRRFVWKYGLGLIRPRTPFLGSYVRSGYLVMDGTIAGLAKKLGVDPEGLEAAVQANNAAAAAGTDPEFHRGETPYDRANGDPTHKPNPCLGPIAKPPFCAVKVFPTPLGTSLGLSSNASSQVLDRTGVPIPGLYACGNDAHSVFGGEYPGAGAQLGLAMTFGYLAALHAARPHPRATA